MQQKNIGGESTAKNVRVKAFKTELQKTELLICSAAGWHSHLLARPKRSAALGSERSGQHPWQRGMGMGNGGTGHSGTGLAVPKAGHRWTLPSSLEHVWAVTSSPHRSSLSESRTATSRPATHPWTGAPASGRLGPRTRAWAPTAARSATAPAWR